VNFKRCDKCGQEIVESNLISKINDYSNEAKISLQNDRYCYVQVKIKVEYVNVYYDNGLDEDEDEECSHILDICEKCDKELINSLVKGI